MNRCTGHCCRGFFLPKSPDEIVENYSRTLMPEYGPVNGSRLIEDIEIVATMVIPLRLVRAGEFNPWQPALTVQHDGWTYTCRHLQSNGDCGIYATRPAVCRDYPYGRACEYADCTWDACRTATMRSLCPGARIDAKKIFLDDAIAHSPREERMADHG